MKAVKVGYYECGVKTGRNAEFPIVVLFDHGQWSRNVIKARGLDGRHKCTRLATPEEVAAHTGPRLMSYRYRTLDGLIEDESAVCPDASFVETLKTLFGHLREGRR